jgi:hypothetical protein
VLSLSKHAWGTRPFHHPPFDKLRAGMERAATRKRREQKASDARRARAAHATLVLSLSKHG